jgi:hypothetical protein
MGLLAYDISLSTRREVTGMQSKKTTKKSKKARPTSRSKAASKVARLVRLKPGGVSIASPANNGSFKDGDDFGPHPIRRNPETAEEREKREKRLAARKALTLKAFRMAYENHHSRKSS